MPYVIEEKVTAGGCDGVGLGLKRTWPTVNASETGWGYVTEPKKLLVKMVHLGLGYDRIISGVDCRWRGVNLLQFNSRLQKRRQRRTPRRDNS